MTSNSNVAARSAGAPGPPARPAAAATLITVAPTGAESDKAAVPALPVTLDELAATAVGCRAAGAAVIHVHIRDADARPTLDLGRLKDTVQALESAINAIEDVSDVVESILVKES